MCGEGNPTDPQQAAAKRKQLVFELNRNGQYLALKEQLKAGVLRIVKEQYHKSGGMGKDEMQASDCDCLMSGQCMLLFTVLALQCCATRGCLMLK